ncbi:hypothetical protein OESDEN_20924 [Oesophagostomum dentatum]|uniref:Uncharacterized protein n=1 Tax=Oesophagostomum dentatum TaxID=61180 RepID=A0A0B1S867_OESDE|nr:hypothetical protein OESDEN_20924 [Oesophagostomum dentatum]
MSNMGTATTRTKTSEVKFPDLAIGPKIWETWNQLSYQVFDAITREELRLTAEEGNWPTNNTWLCVPQLISNLACLVCGAFSLNGPSEALRRELLNETQGAELNATTVRGFMPIF